MSTRRRTERPLGDVAERERRAFEMLLAGSEPAAAPRAPEPTGREPRPVEATPSEGRTPVRPTRPRRTPSSAPVPSEQGSGSVVGATRVGVTIPPEIEGRLHRAAYRLGGEPAKSRIVRDALGVLLDELEALASSDPVELASRARGMTVGDLRGGLIVRRYIVDGETRERMRRLAAEARIPVSSQVREAIVRWAEREG